MTASLPPRTPAPALSYTPTSPRSVTVCLPEPRSLYRYARPEPARAHYLALLTDGPIDQYAYAHAPVLLTALPSPANGGVQTRTVPVSPGETVVDALGRVLPLAEGLSLLLADGRLIVYDGAGPVALPQVEVTFRLRPGLRWSDGQPLTAADSVYAFELGRSPDSTDPLALIARRTARYAAPDEATIVWTGVPGYVEPLAYTHLWPPLPRHRWHGLTPVEIAESEDANRAPLSYGPFVVEAWDEGERLVLARNPHYWRAAEGLPRLGRVEVTFVNEAEALARALRDGSCQLAPSGPLLDAAVPLLGAAGAVQVSRVPGPMLEHLDFGLAPADEPARLADARVRAALAVCLDRAALAPNPGAPVPDSYVPAAHPLHAAGLALYSFDPERGRALLAEAGWPAGQALRLVGGPAGDPAREALLAALRAQWADHCGLTVTAQSLTEGELLGDWPLGAVFGRRFDLAVFGWRVGVLPPCGLYTSLQVPSADNPGGTNAAGYANPAFDGACYRALTATDPASATAAHAEAQRLLAADLPMLPLFYRPRHGAAGPAVSGYVLDGSSESELWNIEGMAVNEP